MASATHTTLEKVYHPLISSEPENKFVVEVFNILLPPVQCLHSKELAFTAHLRHQECPSQGTRAQPSVAAALLLDAAALCIDGVAG
jgi:hypothetical protein